MKKNRMILFIFIFMLGLCRTVSAGTLLFSSCGVNYNSATQTVTVSGSVSPKTAGAEITYKVLNPQKQSADVKPPVSDPVSSVLNYANHIVTDQNGNFNYTYKMSGDAGEYTAVLGGTDFSEQKTVRFDFFSVQDELKLLVQINLLLSENKPSELYDCLKDANNAKYIGLTRCEEFNALSENNQKAICQSLIDIYKKNGSAYMASKDFLDCVVQLSVVIALKSDADHFQQNLIANAAKTGLDKNKTYDTYTVYLTETAQNHVNLAVRLSNAVLCADLIEIFNNKVVVAAVKYAKGYGDIPDLLAKHNDILKIDLSKYNDKNRDYIDKNLMGSDNGDPDDIKNKFNALAAYVPPEPPGGGSSGSSKGSAVVPAQIITDISPATAVKRHFNDLDEVEWAKEGINYLYESGVINGKNENAFYPNDKIKREEIAKIISIAFNFNQFVPAASFGDIQNDNIFAGFISGVSNAGIMQGISEGEFGAGGYLTREDMATILYRIIEKFNLRLTYSDTTPEFTDGDSISTYAGEAVNAIKRAGIINGMGEGSFAHKSFITRAETVKIIYPIVKLYISRQYLF
mgnify:CR=1 FL=1